MSPKRLLGSDLPTPALSSTARIRITVTNAFNGQQVCKVLLESSTLGKQLFGHVRLRVKKPSGSPGFVFMALVFRDRELELGLYLANQGILVDSTLVCVWKEVNVSVLKHVKTSFWKRKDFSNEQLLMWENVDHLTIPGNAVRYVNGVPHLNDGSLPGCLRSLSFDNYYDYCPNLVSIPSCVQTIVFGDSFNQPL